MRTLTDRVVLITGASRGLGVAMARRFAREGSRLALAARSGSDLEKVKGELEEHGAKALAVPADVSDLESLRAMLKEVESALGPVDVLVNNAGIEEVFDFEKVTPERIEQIVQVNLTGTLWLTRLVLPSMIERRAGHICNISSLGGVTPYPHNAVYAATKHGLVGLSRSLRMELEEHGVEVSVICPGFVEGGMFLEWGRPALKSAGSVTPEDVAVAVVRAVRENKGEIIVTKGLGKMARATFATAPELAAKMMKRVGGARFLAEQAKINAERAPKR